VSERGLEKRKRVWLAVLSAVKANVEG
jgi:hypothetical protein